MESGATKTIKTFLIILVTLIISATSMCFAQADTAYYQIPTKGKKKIKIAVLDLISSIEVSAMACKYYNKWAKERGWEIQVFDLNANYAQAVPMMENIITAGYDGIIVNWTDFKYFAPQIMRAYKKGIPVQGVSCGAMVPGVVAQAVSAEIGFAALSSQYLTTQIKTGEKVLIVQDPRVATQRYRANTAKVTFESYNIKIAQDLHWNGSGDPSQSAYEMVKAALLADAKKEIKGIWTGWEGYGLPAARAAHDMGRKDIVVVTCDDAPNTYKAIREMPNLYATSGAGWSIPEWTNRLFRTFDKIFAGKPVKYQETWFTLPDLVTKDNVPPPGYLFNPNGGYKNRPPDFKIN